MAQLDVSEVIDDPDFADPIVIVRRRQTVDHHGRASVRETRVNAIGVIIQASGETLMREPEGASIRAGVGIDVYTKTAVAPANGRYDADEIEWQSQRYTVESVKDWSNFGVGFYVASCTLKAISP